MTATSRAYVGVGSNLDVPAARVRAGMAALRELPDSRVIECSSLYRTAPIGMTDQPDFINAVCLLDTGMEAHVLMRRLLAIENAQGRARGPISGGPRTLDLDLLLYDDMQLQSPALTLPHPRLHERAFVLYPLFEIAPGLHVPGRGPLAELLAACREQAIVRLGNEAVRQESN